MKYIITFLMIIMGSILTAQVTSIPDPYFEEWLIDHNIDSDGIINGQMLTSDAVLVTEISIDGWDGWSNIASLNGIQDFTALERLTIYTTEITELDVSHNLQLKELKCGSNALTDIDLSANVMLEVIDIGTLGDVGPWNFIQTLDLSSNPNIHTIRAYDCMDLEVINLRNGANNPNMYMDLGLYPDWTPEGVHNDVCIEIDNEEDAQNGQLPYSGWEIDHLNVSYQLVENCLLRLVEFDKPVILVYPNPANGRFTISSTSPIRKITVYDSFGRMMLEEQYNNDNIEASVTISTLQTGNYIIKTTTIKGTSTQKLLVN